MKRLLLLLVLIFGLAPFGIASSHHVSYSGHRSAGHHASRKSTAPGRHDGHYAGGRGSSHKGGHYKNPTTHNHYRNRKPS